MKGSRLYRSLAFVVSIVLLAASLGIPAQVQPAGAQTSLAPQAYAVADAGSQDAVHAQALSDAVVIDNHDYATAADDPQATPHPHSGDATDIVPLDVLGTKRVMVLRVYFHDYANASRYSTAQVDGFFGELDTLWRNTSYNKINIEARVTDLFQLPANRSAYIDDFSDGDLSNGSKFSKVLNDSIANAPGGLDWSNLDAVMVVMAETSMAQFHRGQGGGGCNLNMGPGGPIKSVGCAIFSENPIDSDRAVWGRWAHEIGHAFQVGGPAHPSNYNNEFELMDRNMPGQTGVFEKQSNAGFPGWLPAAKYASFTPSCAVGGCVGVGGGTAFIWAEEYDPTGMPNKQAVKAYISNSLYYLISVRRRVLGDDLNAAYGGIPDEGVLIERVSEGSDPWVTVQGKGGVRTVLWKQGDLYTNASDGISISVAKKVDDDNYQVFVRYGDNSLRPDVGLNPWVSPPGNTWETTDIWVDSPVNGYGTYRYGSWSDGAGGTVPRGNGDDPAVGQLNRLYARVRNFGGQTATNIVVRFDITDPPGKGINGANGFIGLGTVTSVQFPSLASLAAGSFTDVYLEWTPSFPLTPEQIAAGIFYFHTCVRVRLDAVSGETVLGNQDGVDEQENIDYFQTPAPGMGAAKYSDFIHLRNDDPARRKYFYLNYVPHLPDGWTVDLNNGVFGLELDPGQQVDIPIVIQSGGSVTPTVGDIFNVDVAASSQRMLVNALDPKDMHVEFKQLGGVTVQAYVLQMPRLRCDGISTASPNHPFIWGRLENIGDYLPPTGQGLPIFLEGVDSKRNFLPLSAQIVYTDRDGNFMGYLNDRNQMPLREVICLFAGTDKLASASSGYVRLHDPQRVAYVYNAGDNAMGSFNTFLSNHGLAVDQVPLAQASFFDFSADIAIIVGANTGGQGSFFSASAANALKASGKPLLGLSEGGAALFDAYGLDIGYGDTWYATGSGIIVVNSLHSVWSSPWPLAVSTNELLSLYNADAALLAVYRPTPRRGITPIGRQIGAASHYPLISQSMNGQCATLWGFSGAPVSMTSTGKDVFLNLVLDATCQSSVFLPTILSNN